MKPQHHYTCGSSLTHSLLLDNTLSPFQDTRALSWVTASPFQSHRTPSMRLCNPEPPLQPSVTYYDCLPLLSPPGFIKKSIMNNGFHITTLARVVMCMYVLSASCIKGLGWLCFQYNSILLLTLLPSPPPPLPSWHQCFSLHLSHCQCPRLVALSVYISFCCH